MKTEWWGRKGFLARQVRQLALWNNNNNLGPYCYSACKNKKRNHVVSL